MANRKTVKKKEKQKAKAFAFTPAPTWNEYRPKSSDSKNNTSVNVKDWLDSELDKAIERKLK